MEMLYWIFCPGHAGVIGNERADTLAGQAPISGDLTLDPPTVLANENELLLMPLTNSYLLDALKLKEKGIKLGYSRASTLSDKLRRCTNQITMGTVSIHVYSSVVVGEVEGGSTVKPSYYVNSTTTPTFRKN